MMRIDLCQILTVDCKFNILHYRKGFFFQKTSKCHAVIYMCLLTNWLAGEVF